MEQFKYVLKFKEWHKDLDSDSIRHTTKIGYVDHHGYLIFAIKAIPVYAETLMSYEQAHHVREVYLAWYEAQHMTTCGIDSIEIVDAFEEFEKWVQAMREHLNGKGATQNSEIRRFDREYPAKEIKEIPVFI